MIQIFWPINIALAIITSVLSLIILSIVMKNHKLVKSRITRYLTIFAALMFVANITSVVMYFRLALNYGPDVAMPLIPINALLFLSILFLVWIIKE